MYGSEELDKQLRTLLPNLGVPELGKENIQQCPPKEPTVQMQDISASQLPKPETQSNLQPNANLKPPSDLIKDPTASELEPEKMEEATESQISVQSSAKETAEHIEDISAPKPAAVRKDAAAECHRSCLGDLEQARGIWDNMKANLQEPAAAQKPLLPLPAFDNTAATVQKPLAPLPASNTEAPVEAGPQRAQQRATGYRSTFSFIKQKD